MGAERVLLVGCELTRDGDGWPLDASLAELGQLARTAGLAIAGRERQRLPRPNPATYIGSGKAAQIAELASSLGVDVVLFDDELAPNQQRNLEQILGEEVKVLDRSALILDVFASHARSHEGKIQVELAQLEYRLPRLTRMWTHLARQAGGRSAGNAGVGVRGPGETQLEVDRRRVRTRISRLRKDLQAISAARSGHRERRRRSRVPVAALVGYANAGKSTLMNALTGAGVRAENRLFATLDPTTRRVQVNDVPLLLTDTVGFVQKLPANLVAAFRATLEEVVEADLLIHVVDARHPMAREQAAEVMRVLRELGAADRPTVTVLNKVDRVEDGMPLPDVMEPGESARAIPLSALHKQGFDELRAALAQAALARDGRR